MLGSSAADFEAYCKDARRMKKVKGRVRKGIPDEFRGYVWQLLSGATGVLVFWGEFVTGEHVRHNKNGILS
jgi:hypothetical protein